MTPIPRSIRRRAAGLAVCVLTGASIQLGAWGSVPAHAALRAPVRSSYTIGPGLRLTTIRYASTPNEVRILTITQGGGSVVDLFTPTRSYPGYAKPSAMGSHQGGTAIVNGDFAAPDGRPEHLSMVDGELWTSGLQGGGWRFGVTSDGSRAYAGRPELVTKANRSGTSIKVTSWNAGGPRKHVAGFSHRGGRVERPSGDPTPSADDPRYCAARLIPTGGFGWVGPGKAGIARPYSIAAQPEPCTKTPLALGTDPGAVVLTGKNGRRGGDAVKALRRGMAIRLTWRLAGWPGVVDVIGGRPLLVRDGHNVAPHYHSGASYFYNFNPRTALGLGPGCADSDSATMCKTYILTVDGRQSDEGWSKGMRFPPLAHELIAAGATWAINIDGGGGTVMWVAKRDAAYCEAPVAAGGCRVTRPSDRAGERAAVVAIGVRPAPDAGEPRVLLG